MEDLKARAHTISEVSYPSLMDNVDQVTQIVEDMKQLADELKRLKDLEGPLK